MSDDPVTSTIGRFLVLHDESFSTVGISSNAYVLPFGERHYLFDAGGHPSLLSFVESAGISRRSIAALFLTHGHYDHIRGAASLIGEDIPIYLSKDDFELAEECLGRVKIREIHEGSMLLDQLQLKVVPTPGHTKGSICFHSPAERLLISGDTVFSNGIFGRTDLPGGSNSEMLASLRRLSRLDIEMLLPGHGPCLLKGGKSSITTALANALCLLK